ncbi:Oidioi.mRNA.OKI2018_I69.PAR.g12238.t1.cds [Oikopleura dioica]|uniref:Oidioi.mRNA.OKI2018_I69.PAR.g12238.t1.cds n=1 Tax=Oikopleura dioica TaxID=34765 RepID=A0ABN7S310_OIKDI|nr:Oidioi.mRNA.OKI2018_I69.PAR.g12238.t1.cds [Oikopleura dioica]
MIQLEARKSDCCNQAKFEARLYACLQCVDVDLCQECYASGTVFGSHQRNHTCVWQRTGQNSFSCSCGERHIIRTLFTEHFTSERHQNWANGTTGSTQTTTTTNNSSTDATDSHVIGASSPSTPTASSAPSETMDRRARVNELLGTYHPSNQSSNVPTTSSYSSIRDDSSPSYTSSYRSRSPSRYNPENSNYAQRRARLGLDNNDDSTPSYSATRRARLGLDNDDDNNSSYTSRRSRLGLDNDSAGDSYTSRYARQRSERESSASDISRMSRNLERSVSSILSGDYRRGAESRSFIEEYENDRRARNGLSRLGSEEPSTSRSTRYGADEEEPSGNGGLSKEEEEMAAKNLGGLTKKKRKKESVLAGTKKRNNVKISKLKPRGYRKKLFNKKKKSLIWKRN